MTDPREYTEEEVTEHFLSYIKDLIHYWDKLPDNYTQRQRMEGLVGSILGVIDGSSSSLPGFKLIPDPLEEDKQYFLDNGANWYPDNCNISGFLQDYLFKGNDS
jgi:hypothetical protein